MPFHFLSSCTIPPLAFAIFLWNLPTSVLCSPGIYNPSEPTVSIFNHLVSAVNTSLPPKRSRERRSAQIRARAVTSRCRHLYASKMQFVRTSMRRSLLNLDKSLLDHRSSQRFRRKVVKCGKKRPQDFQVLRRGKRNANFHNLFSEHYSSIGPSSDPEVMAPRNAY